MCCRKAGFSAMQLATRQFWETTNNQFLNATYRRNHAWVSQVKQSDCSESRLGLPNSLKLLQVTRQNDSVAHAMAA